MSKYCKNNGCGNEGDKSCKICQSSLCENCYNYNENLYLKEWLYNLGNKCEKCEMLGCSNCLTTCFQHWNENDEEYPIICINCSDLKSYECNYHSFDVCQECIEEYPVCPECEANENYAMRHAW